jgi:hypothetical protein
MMSGKSPVVARAAYFFLNSLNNSNLVNRNDLSPLERDLGNFAVDDQKGVPQHKSAFARHIISHRLDPTNVYQNTGCYTKLIFPSQKVTVSPQVINEVAVLNEYVKNYGKDIKTIEVTCDSKSVLNFPGQLQPNQDFWVTPQESKFATVMDRALGLKSRQFPQDEKSGLNMFKHSTRGSIGLLTYDDQGNNIQIMHKPIDTQALVTYNKDFLKDLSTYVQTLDIPELTNTLKNCKKNIAPLTKNSTFQEVMATQTDIQDILWNEVQLHPQFDRSVSFVFLKQISYDKGDDNLRAFEERFKSLLEDKLYDLNNRRHVRKISQVMVLAYSETVDKDIYKKLSYLQKDIGLQFNQSFLEDLARLLKEGLTNIPC